MEQKAVYLEAKGSASIRHRCVLLGKLFLYEKTIGVKSFDNGLSRRRRLLHLNKISEIIQGPMNTASKLGSHTQTDQGTFPGVGL
jgi:hypothetical protein